MRTPHELDPQNYISQIVATEQYRATRKVERFSGENVPRAVSLGAQALAESFTSEHGYKSRQGTRFEVISRINNLVPSVEQLHYLRQNRADKATQRPYAEEVIEFNHSLRNMIDNEPKLTFNQVSNFLVNMYTASNKGRFTDIREWEQNRNKFTQEIEGALRGMRAEIAAEQIIGTMDDVEYDTEVTVDEELNGIDGFVTMRGVEFPVDIKSSQAAMEKARQRSHNPEKIIASCVQSSDFQNDTFRLPPETALKKQPHMRAQLEAVYNSLPVYA